MDRKLLFAFITCISVYLHAQTVIINDRGNIDLPPNPKSGHCYVKCKLEKRGKVKTKWEDVDCAYVKTQKLNIKLNGSRDELSENDKRIIKKTFKEYYREGNIKTLEIISDFGSAASDAVNQKRAVDRGLILTNYLVSLGMKEDYLKLRAVSTEKAIGFSFRLINYTSPP